MKTNISILIIIMLPMVCKGQSDVIIPPEFVETNQPKVGSDDWFSLNHSNHECAVLNVNGKLEIVSPSKIRKSQNPADDCTCKLKIKDGTLKGKNWGEWGGELYYEPDNVKKLNTIIKKGNIKYIFEHNEKLYFIEGLAHLTTSNGALYELSRTGKNFTFKKIYDFEDAPEVFTYLNGKMLIAGSENFYVLDNLKKELVFQKMFWDGLYPNSIAIFDEKNVFVGIRSGIVRLDLIEKKATFFKQAN